MTDVYCSAKYRGQVKNNIDLTKKGKLEVEIKALQVKTWAIPNVPYAGKGVGLYLIPPVDSWVWIEFENGNKESPIWTGCFWEETSDLPPEAIGPGVKVLKTDKGKITINDLDGEIVIQVSQLTVKMATIGEKIELTSGTSKIEINGSTITLTVGERSVQVSATNVWINNGALEVT